MAKKIFKKIQDGHYDDARKNFKSCFGEKTVPNCLSDLKYYNDFKSSPKLSAYESEKLYDQHLTFRDESLLPKEFLAVDEAGHVKNGFVRIPNNLFELAKKQKWLVETYKTRDRGGFDASHNLLIIGIPGDNVDVIMQIGIDPDEDPYDQIFDPEIRSKSQNFTKGHNTMTMITVDKTKKPPVGQLRKLTLDKLSENYKWSNSLASHDGLGISFCIQCHSTPTRAISPVGYNVFNGKEKLMTPEKKRSIDKINDLLTVPGLGWGHATISGKEHRFGPDIDSQPWGWAPHNSATRKKEFIEKCSAEREPIRHRSRDQELYEFKANPNPKAKVDWKNVASAMTCVACHNGKERGILNSQFQERTIAFKLLVSRDMPQYIDPTIPVTPDLNLDERILIK